MAASNIIVGTEEAATKTVFRILSSSDSFHLFSEKWVDICLDLEIDSVSIKTWKQNQILDKDSLKEVVNKMLETWVSAKGSKAFLSELISVLNSNGMNKLSELLEKELDCLTKQCKKYCRIPQGLQDFFLKETDTNLAIISTPSSYITREKIRENTKNCYLLSADKFFEELSCDIGFTSGQIYVVTVTNPYGIEELLETVESSESVPKLLIISEDKEEVIKQKIKANFFIHKDEMEWDDLTPRFKLEKKRKLEGEFGVKYKKLSGVVSGQILVELINDEKLKIFEDNIPSELLVSYYVPRMIIKRAFLNKHRLFQESLSNDVFLFTGMDKITLEGFVKSKMTMNSSNLLQNQSIANYRYIVLDDPTDFINICDTTREAVHLIDFKDGYFQWRKSNKSIGTIQKMIIEKPDKAHFLTEEEFITELVSRDEPKVVCISDSPGMGKSVLLASIGKQLMDRFGPQRIVFFASARDLTNLMHGNLDQKTFELALQTLCCKNNLEKETLSAKLDSNESDTAKSANSKVELLLDGFDEIDWDLLPFAGQFLKFLQNDYNSIRVWANTRPYHLQMLEKELNTIGYNIQPFTEHDQIQFLTSFWSNQTPGLDKNKLEKFSRNCLLVLDFNVKSFNSGTIDQGRIAEIPLQCLLLAEVYEKNAVSWCSPTRSFDFKGEDFGKINSVATMYQRFVENKIQKYEKTYSVSSKVDITSIYAMHSKLALDLMFPHSFPKDLATSYDASVPIEELVNVGLLQVANINSTLSPTFIHRTFAEYFCAHFVLNEILKKEVLSDKIMNFTFNVFLNTSECERFEEYQDSIYEFINVVPCFFLNSLLYDDVNISMAKRSLPPRDISLIKMQTFISACASDNFQNLFRLFEEHPSFTSYAADLLDEKFILHSVKHYNLDMLKVFLDSFEKHSRYTSRLNQDALYLAFDNGDAPKFKYLLHERWTDSNEKGELDIHFLFQRCINPGLEEYEFIEDNEDFQPFISVRTEMLRLLKDIDETIVQKSFFNSSQSPLLEPMYLKFHFDFVKWGADSLTKDENGNTFLHLIPKLQARFLQYLDKFPALKEVVCLKNSKGWTPLALALKEKVHFSKECIAKLKELGTDFNEIFDGTPLFILAIQSGNDEDVLRFMIENGVDVSCKSWETGDKEKTFLDFAAEVGNADAVRLLVEEFKMDVNGSKANSKTPLDYLILGWISRKTDDDNWEKYFPTGLLIWILGGKYKLTTPKRLQEFAIEKHDFQALLFSLETGLDVKKQDEDGNTLLHLLVQKWVYSKAIEITLKYGGDLSIKNNKGLTPSDLALRTDPRRFYMEFIRKQCLELLNIKDFKWSNMYSLVSSENLANFLVNSAQYISSEDEFISLFNEVLKQRNASTDSCLLSLFKTGRCTISPDRFHLVITNLILSGNVDKLFTVSPENKLTVFHRALQNIQGIKLESLNLLQRIPGIDLKIKDQMGGSCLFYAIEGGQTPEFLEMLSSHAGDLKQKDIKGENLLHKAVTTNNSSPEMISFLIEKELNPNEEDNNGDAPLHFLMDYYHSRFHILHSSCRLKLAEALLQNGASLKIKNKFGCTPLDLALGNMNRNWSPSDNPMECFQFIWEHKNLNQDPTILSLNLNREYLNTLLTIQSMKLTEEQFRYLVKQYLKRVVAENCEERKKSPWHNFIWNGSFIDEYKSLDSDRFHTVVELVLSHDHENGDVFGDEDENGARPMHHIVEHLRVQERTFELLRSRDIDLGATDNNGWSVLFYAVKGKNATPRYLNLLEKYGGGDFKRVDNSGQNLLHLAVKDNFNNNLDVMEFLLDKERVGLDPNKVDINGDTPLHILLKESVYFREVVVRKAKLLMKAGADIHLKNLEGETALDLAGHVRQWSTCKEWLLKTFSTVFL